MTRGSLVAAATVTIAGAMLLGSAGATAYRSHSCGPADSKTVMAGRNVRIYAALPEPESEEEHFFACLVATGRSRKLEAPRSRCRFRDCLWVSVETAPLAIHAPWIAYPESFHGRDTSVLAIAVMNLRTGRSRIWEVGARRGAPRNAPSVTDVALKRNGSVAWIAVRPVRQPVPVDGPVYETPGSQVAPPVATFRLEHRREVVACGANGEQVLDQGEGIDLHSLALQGSTLTWKNVEETRTALLE